MTSIDLLKEYRKLDDTINMRLNRTNAQFRDRDREGKGKGNVQDEACLYLWRNLIGAFATGFSASCPEYLLCHRKLETPYGDSIILRRGG